MMVVIHYGHVEMPAKMLQVAFLSVTKVAFVMLIQSTIPRTRTLTGRMKIKSYLVMVGLLYSTMEELWKKIDYMIR